MYVCIYLSIYLSIYLYILLLKNVARYGTVSYTKLQAATSLLTEVNIFH